MSESTTPPRWSPTSPSATSVGGEADVHLNPARPATFGPRLLVAAALILTAFVLVPIVGPIMHDNDQASLLTGALQLARGAASPWSADFYNYDKQYATYWLLAGAHRVWSQTDVVTLGNVCSFAIFWLGVVAAVWRGRIRRFAQAAGITTCVLAPALWLHSAFLGTSTVSAGLVLLAWAIWPRRPTVARSLVSLLLLAGAVGCRADAVLVLPWFFWTVTPASSVLRLARRPALYAIAGAGLLALLVGRAISSHLSIDAYPPFVNARIYAAYSVFGLGAAAATLAWVTATLFGWACRRQSRGIAAYYGLGIAALLLPWAFYSAQMFSTRYWTPILCALMLGLLSRRGSLLLGGANRRALTAALAALLAAAVGPAIVGLQLPFPARPRLVVAEPTMFPTGDGRQPMGAMIFFLHRIATAPNHVVDHNQPIWLAAKATALEVDATGHVPIFDAPLCSYLQLAAELRSQSSYLVSEHAGAFYADSRDLLRICANPNRELAADRRAFAARLHARAASPAIGGYEIIRHDLNGPVDPTWPDRVALARAIAGNEYELRPEFRAHRTFTLRRSDAGKTVILFSREPFAAELNDRNGGRHLLTATSDPGTNLHIAVVPSTTWVGNDFTCTAGDPTVALTVYPDYMNITRL
jgi:hypothetical protein